MPQKPLGMVQEVREQGALHFVGEVGGEDAVKGQGQQPVKLLGQPGVDLALGQLLLQILERDVHMVLAQQDCLQGKGMDFTCSVV